MWRKYSLYYTASAEGVDLWYNGSMKKFRIGFGIVVMVCALQCGVIMPSAWADVDYAKVSERC